MSRRRGSIVDVLLVLPWWVSVVVAWITYLVLLVVVPGYFAKSPMTVGIANASKAVAPYATGLFLLVSLGSLIRSWSISRKFDALNGAEGIRQLSWRQFEAIVGEAFRRRGFSVTENAVDGPDGGIDLVLRKDSEKFYVQCKQWKQWKVGVKPIRELYGVITAGGAAGGYFVASGEYTLDAREFARKVSIELIDGAKLVEMVRSAREPRAFLDPSAGRREPTIEAPLCGSPACPNCGRVMVLRRAAKGPGAGERFWGCPGFPKCRGTRAA
jgi:restriction system protein